MRGIEREIERGLYLRRWWWWAMEKCFFAGGRERLDKKLRGGEVGDNA